MSGFRFQVLYVRLPFSDFRSHISEFSFQFSVFRFQISELELWFGILLLGELGSCYWLLGEPLERYWGNRWPGPREQSWAADLHSPLRNCIRTH